MKLTILTVIVAFAVSLGAVADNVQRGYVKTRGRMAANGQVIAGKRLGAATVELQGGSSVQSDAAGDFALRTSAPQFYLKNVRKQGYIVADPDLLSRQYVCNANPLILVLDEPTTWGLGQLRCFAASLDIGLSTHTAKAK